MSHQQDYHVTDSVDSDLQDCVFDLNQISHLVDKKNFQHIQAPHHDQNQHKSYPNYDHSSCAKFKANISPVIDLRAENSSNKGRIEFQMRRKNRVVTLSWEGFMGRVGANGSCFLEVCQSISNLPKTPQEFVVRCCYKTSYQSGFVRIAPKGANISFFFNLAASGQDVCKDDCFLFPGSSISWITEN